MLRISIGDGRNPRLWRFVGRRDDVLVLSNGEKFNPVDMEGVVTGHPRVRGALNVGTGRFQAALVIEPMEPLGEGTTTTAASDFIDALWPTIERANAVGPTHGRIFRPKVVVAGPDKAFIRAGKGTVIRGRTTRLFEDEVDALFRVEEDAGVVAVSVDSLESVTAFVRQCVAGLFPSSTTLSDDDDFFALGLDSLQTLELMKMLRRGLASHLESVQGAVSDPITTRSVYAHPTINQLAGYLFKAVSSGMPGTVADEDEDNDNKETLRVKAMQDLVAKYTAGLPNVNARRPASLTVAIFGTTGSLGTHLLGVFPNDAAVKKIYCLNRSDDARARQQAAFEARGKAYDLASKAEFLAVSMGDAHFGVGKDVFRRLQASVDVFVHSAWKVDFHHGLASFADTHIRGVRHLVDFALASERQPHLFYVSSLSSVGRWPAVRPGAVTEDYLSNYRLALDMGYGESKHVAEKILEAATVRSGVHATILRVGQIAGPLADDGGQWNPAEWLPSLVKSSLALGCLPSSMNTVEWIPVDTLAGIMRDLVQHDYAERAAGVYNLVNPRAGSCDELVGVVKKHWDVAGTPVEVVLFPAWLEALRSASASSPASATAADLDNIPALKIVDFYEGLAAEAALPESERITYEKSRGRKHSKTMAELGPIDGAAMATWLKQWGL
ncbi:hypothetical protein SCUCBS95973_002999 [Sporothrix curviconia]|uniref:Carrier domain-containing protein n=1 Tax=Sporothrix curviconia TaxID=1260050 RepID=A0ABP0BBM0_9PEZI